MTDWIWILIVFILYFVVLVGISVYQSSRMVNMGDYVLGGRRLNSFTIAMSTGSSACSAWTILVFPALAFIGGLMHLWTGVFIVLGMLLMWIVVAKRLRRYTIATDNSLTIPEFWEKRFGDTTGALRGLSATIALYFITLYICSGLIAGAKLLENVFGLGHSGSGHDIGIIITLIAVTTYTFIGGFLAVSRTDVFQAFIMLSGFIIIPVTLILNADKPFAAFENVGSGFWNPFNNVEGEPLGMPFYLSSIGWGVGAFGSLRISSRFMAMKNETDIPQSKYLSMFWVAMMFTLGLLTGLVASPALTSRGVEIQDAEQLYITVSTTFFHPAVSGVLLAAVIAAVMSTADSQLLAASALASSDVPWMRRVTQHMQAKGKVVMGRLLLVTIGVGAAMFSITFPESIFTLVSLAWGGMGAAFGPVTVMALYWRRFNLWGAYTGAITGTVVATFWWLMSLGHQGLLNLAESLGFGNFVTNLQEVGVWEINPAIPGAIAATGLSIMVTLLTSPPSDEITQLFDEVNSPDWINPVTTNTQG